MDREAPLLLRNGLEWLFTPSRRQKSATYSPTRRSPATKLPAAFPWTVLNGKSCGAYLDSGTGLLESSDHGV